MKTYTFEVESIESGQRRSDGDIFDSYKVTSTEHEWDVKNFCMKVLKRSYEKKDMPHPFVGQMLEFKKITNNNEGNSFLNKREPETYSYKVKTLYTG